MKPSSVLELTPWTVSTPTRVPAAFPRKAAWVLPQGEYVLNVAVIYQDARAREWAMEVCDSVTQLSGKEFIRSTWWKISRLPEPEAFAKAAWMMIQADVLVVAIDDTKGLPGEFFGWLDSWLSRRRLPTGAMIALVCRSDQPDTAADGAQERLRAIARKARLDFLTREHGKPGALAAWSRTDRIASGPSTPSFVLQEASTPIHVYHHWGINE